MENQELISFNNLKQVLIQYGNAVQELYKNNLIKEGNIATSGLIESVKYIKSFGNRKYEISLSLKPYWKYLEYGTKAHWPPIGNGENEGLLRWVNAKINAKLLIPRPDSNGKLPTEKQLAFLIARAMAGKSPHQSECKNPNGGTQAEHLLKKTIEEVNAEYMSKIYNAIDKDIDESVFVLLNNFEKSW